MSYRQGRPRRVRSLFVSDVHLGSRFAHAEAFLRFLESQEPESLYIVGDFIDGWRLRQRWHWQPIYNRILHRLWELGEAGTLIRYAPGNHDNFLRHFLLDFGFLEIQDEFIHQAVDGRRFVVLHGDQFDNVELCAQWLSVVGAWGYDSLMWFNGQVNACRKWLGLAPWQFSSTVKKSVKTVVNFVSNFEARLAEHARSTGCHGVICGHVHMPLCVNREGIAYFNTGDWVENCTALAEYTDGSWELMHLPLTDDEVCQVERQPLSDPAPAAPAEPSQDVAVENEQPSAALLV